MHNWRFHRSTSKLIGGVQPVIGISKRSHGPLTLADYERYRDHAAQDEECMRLVEEATALKLIVSYERSFLRPMLE
ncbi:NIPSNAP family protein [Pseudomonas syringae group sp. J309-1]|uniref:NIPSNAP family protein n=1 Tax=Pseudomonas syringae group sp. J309-1 TaxID=3079588 RepID=UPI002910B257|nr:NIPSNAP family protein [Pseudomonas syringae group sp. J309-1]MDU8358397.1 NIPSNAP family protein [Pseudomonas syringae group sp. J309-1]